MAGEPVRVQPAYPDDDEEFARMRRVAECLELDGLSPIRRGMCSGFRVPVPDVPMLPDGSAQVYVVRCAEFVKIGMAQNVSYRIRTLISATPFDLHLVAVLPGGQAAERALHLRFSEHRHRDEWFRIEGALAEWIRAGCPA